MKIINQNSPLDDVFTSAVGTVIKVTGDYERVLNRLEEECPSTISFEYTEVLPGTSHYTLYGAQTLVVTKATLI